MSDWINIDDDTPKEAGLYLIAMLQPAISKGPFYSPETKQVRVAIWKAEEILKESNEYQAIYQKNWYFYVDDAKAKYVTYWMPFPKYPNS